MIIIANYDPFGADSMVYTFENVCKEFPELEYKDGLKFIYFNTTGTKNIKKAKKELLTYLNHSKIKNVTNEDIARIHDYVSSVKQSAEVEERYMTIGELMDHSKAEGLLEGERRGRIEGRISALLEILADLGDIPEEVRGCINCADEVTLKQWTKIAAKSESMEAFLEQI